MTGQQEKAMKTKTYKNKYESASAPREQSIWERIKSQINDFSKPTTISGMGGVKRVIGGYDIVEDIVEEELNSREELES